MDRSEFEKLVVVAVERLPLRFKNKLENVDIVIEDSPAKQDMCSDNVEGKGCVLGLYRGVPLNKRTHYYGMVMPDKITIFQKNIERLSKGKKDLSKIITRTLYHEIAHDFGFSDKCLKEKGLY
ncbi:MAG: metallopeptidase family protein [Candidatus Omnitrophota bacterium]